MSDIEIPNIDFDTQTSLTEGPEHDDLTGTSGNDLFISAINGFATLNPADIIRGGPGGDDQLSITITGTGGQQAVGFFAEDIDVLQIRNFNVGGTDPLVNMIDVIGTSTIWLDNNTGDTDFTFVQNIMDLVATGGDFNADVSYTAAATAGMADTQEILIQGTDADFDISGGIENVWLHANGPASMLDINSMATTFKVAGDAMSVDIDQGGANLMMFDSTLFEGAVHLDASVAAGATVDTLKGKDVLNLTGNGGDLTVKSRNGGDSITAATVDDVIIKAGKGLDTVDVDATGTVDVFGGKGEDSIDVSTGTNPTDDAVFIDSGDKTDSVLVQQAGHTHILAGKGADSVTTQSIWGDLTVDLGPGNSGSLSSNIVVGNASVDGGVGIDSVSISDARGYVNVNLGDGASNSANLSNNNAAWWEDLVVNGGVGADTVTIRGNADLFANLYGGNDTVNLQSGSSAVWERLGLDLAEGNDTVNLGSNYLFSNDTIAGGTGNDLITATSLLYLSSGSAFGGTSGVATLQTSSHWTGTFWGDSTLANAKGITTYNLNGNITGTTSMRQMGDGVMVNMRDSGGNHAFYYDTANSAGGTANLKFTLSGSTTFGTFDLDDVGTLNVMGVDNIIGIPVPTLTLGSGASFVADDDLTTVNLSGSAHVTMGSVSANNLATIDGSTMGRNIVLDLDNVAAAIDVDTGSGNDRVNRDDASTDFDIDTGAGNDTVGAGGGDDNVKLGLGNDWVDFTAATLDDFDTVDGGGGTDTLRITSGALTENDDDIFFGIDVENWILSGSADTLSLGNIAQSSGLQKIYLNGTGSVSNGIPVGNGNFDSGNDSITLQASFANPLEVTLGNGGIGSDDTVDAGASAATLTLRAASSNLDGWDVLTGGTGMQDEIVIYEVDAYNVSLGSPGSTTGIEKITITPFDTDNIGIFLDGDNNVAAGETLTISTRTDWSPQGDLDVFGSGETDGMLVVTGGWGDDSIESGEQDDTITTNQGNDTVNANGGDDDIDTGSGNDNITGGMGADSIVAGSGNDYILGDTFGGGGSADTIDAGSGADEIFAAGGGDIINVGVGDGAVDVLVYGFLSDSSAADVDQVTGFLAGAGGDIIDLTTDGFELFGDGQQFVGNAASFGAAQGLLTNGDGIDDVVFEQTDTGGTLWVDLNDDGTLNADDLQINLIGVAALDDNGDGTSDNLMLIAIPAP